MDSVKRFVPCMMHLSRKRFAWIVIGILIFRVLRFDLVRAWADSNGKAGDYATTLHLPP